MLNRSASLAMSTNVLKALPGKLDITQLVSLFTLTLNDIILTNYSCMCMKNLDFCTAISDCHNFIFTVINSNII